MTTNVTPIELVFVRHGESEGERARGPADQTVPGDFHARLPRSWRLTDHGTEQARSAGAWLAERDEHRFDAYAVSPMLRAVETAVGLALPDARWRVEAALADRSWGPVVRAMTAAERAQWWDRSRAEAAADPWFWAPPSGESLASVQARVRALLAGLALHGIAGRHLFVTHAEVIQAVRGIFEGGEQQWVTLPGTEPTGHLAMTGYSRRDPEKGILTGGFSWIRGLDPISGHAGGWLPIGGPVPTDALRSSVVAQSPTTTS